jgi:flagellar biosynthesis/type III secretory pathway protein FliH
MYDTREKAIRDRQWAFNAVREEGLEQGREEGLEQGREEGLEQGREEGLEQGREEGEIRGEIKLIQTLQEILGLPVSNSANFEGQSLADLRELTAELRSKIQRRS